MLVPTKSGLIKGYASRMLVRALDISLTDKMQSTPTLPRNPRASSNCREAVKGGPRVCSRGDRAAGCHVRQAMQ